MWDISFCNGPGSPETLIGCILSNTLKNKDEKKTNFWHEMGREWVWWALDRCNRIRNLRSFILQWSWVFRNAGWWYIFENIENWGWENINKSRTFATKWVGNRFHELSLGRNDRAGVGISKIEVLANNSQFFQGKSGFFLFPRLWGRMPN